MSWGEDQSNTYNYIHHREYESEYTDNSFVRLSTVDQKHKEGFYQEFLYFLHNQTLFRKLL